MRDGTETFASGALPWLDIPANEHNLLGCISNTVITNTILYPYTVVHVTTGISHVYVWAYYIIQVYNYMETREPQFARWGQCN